MSCHTSANTPTLASSIALIGHPNVGKSALFQQLTGARVIVSNYPGTTVEIARSAARDLPETTLVDTPGVITFPPSSDDELVTARVLLEEPLTAILQVGDAKNLRRTLYLTLQLAEMGLPMALALNMADEAHSRGVTVDTEALAENLGMEVVHTTAVHGQGIAELRTALQRATTPTIKIEYPEPIEAALDSISFLLPETNISERALGLLFLSGDKLSETAISGQTNKEEYRQLENIRETLIADVGYVAEVVQKKRFEAVNSLLVLASAHTGINKPGFAARLGHLTTHPVWGIGILLAILYVVYWFVGVFGAGTLVGLLEENLFGSIINPAITNLINKTIPWQPARDFLVGEYGLWTMGMTYAMALILPIVSTFFLAFGILEDSGYLPRLAALSNRLFQKLGLNGKAVLPMVLGLGCVTMATLTTRILDSKRERLLVTLLLALAVPCSAQLGVVLGMLAGISFGASMIWVGIVLLVLLTVGWLAAKLVPGDRMPLMVELPPLRLPVFRNVMLKTLARLEWYLKEVVPLFLVGSALVFILDLSGILDRLISISEPFINGWLGLPREASAAFLMGFLRRDFGATGLFVLESQGLMTEAQVVTAMVTITLFIPCIASVMMIARERGWKTAAGMVALVFPIAFLIGGLLYRVLALVRWGLV